MPYLIITKKTGTENPVNIFTVKIKENIMYLFKDYQDKSEITDRYLDEEIFKVVPIFSSKGDFIEIMLKELHGTKSKFNRKYNTKNCFDDYLKIVKDYNKYVVKNQKLTEYNYEIENCKNKIKDYDKNVVKKLNDDIKYLEDTILYLNSITTDRKLYSNEKYLKDVHNIDINKAKKRVRTGQITEIETKINSLNTDKHIKIDKLKYIDDAKINLEELEFDKIKETSMHVKYITIDDIDNEFADFLSDDYIKNFFLEQLSDEKNSPQRLPSLTRSKISQVREGRSNLEKIVDIELNFTTKLNNINFVKLMKFIDSEDKNLKMKMYDSNKDETHSFEIRYIKSSANIEWEKIYM